MMMLFRSVFTVMVFYSPGIFTLVPQPHILSNPLPLLYQFLRFMIYCYFLPLFDRPKIDIVFSNTLKARSCIANQVHNSKKYSLERMKQNTCFEMPLLLQIFDITYIYL